MEFTGSSTTNELLFESVLTDVSIAVAQIFGQAAVVASTANVTKPERR